MIHCRTKKARAYVAILTTASALVLLMFSSSLNTHREPRTGGYNNKNRLSSKGYHPDRDLTREKQRRHEVCAKYGLDKPPDTIVKYPWLLKTAIIDDTRHVMFCYIPKVASGNWKRVFIMLKKDISNPASIETQEAHKDGMLKNLSTCNATGIHFILKNYRQFMIVREPMERLLSAYLNKVYRADYTGKFHKLLGKKGLPQLDHKIPYEEQVNSSERITFSEFVNFVINTSDHERRMEIHWARMHRICHPCIFDYDYIGKYEELQQDSRYILDMIAGGAQHIKLPDVKTDKGKATRSSMAHYFSQLTKGQVMDLLRVYQIDYELFDYPYPGHLLNIARER